MAGDLLGLKSTSDLLVGVLSSRTVEDKLIQKFDLRKVYGVRRMEDARKDLGGPDRHFGRSQEPDHHDYGNR